MKKIFKLTDPKKKPERQVEAVKFEIKKYIKRERNKKLPEGIDYWDFDCKFGDTSESANPIHISEINKSIDHQFQNKKESFYIEILVKTGTRGKSIDQSAEDSDD
jgi:hypothetical protein